MLISTFLTAHYNIMSLKQPHISLRHTTRSSKTSHATSLSLSHLMRPSPTCPPTVLRLNSLTFSNLVSLPSTPTFYFKLPYVAHFSVVTQKRVRHLIKRYCNDLDIKLVFSSFKIGNLFGVKDPIPGGLRSRVVYKFACAGCNACYVAETTRHFSTRVREHLVSDKASHIFKHLENSEHCRALCSVDCFHILDHASTTFQLKIKEAFHIRREQPSLNQQLHHVNLKLSF